MAIRPITNSAMIPYSPDQYNQLAKQSTALILQDMRSCAAYLKEALPKSHICIEMGLVSGQGSSSTIHRVAAISLDWTQKGTNDGKLKLDVAVYKYEQLALDGGPNTALENSSTKIDSSELVHYGSARALQPKHNSASHQGAVRRIQLIDEDAISNFSRTNAGRCDDSILVAQVLKIVFAQGVPLPIGEIEHKCHFQILTKPSDPSKNMQYLQSEDWWSKGKRENYSRSIYPANPNASPASFDSPESLNQKFNRLILAAQGKSVPLSILSTAEAGGYQGTITGQTVRLIENINSDANVDQKKES